MYRCAAKILKSPLYLLSSLKRSGDPPVVELVEATDD